MSQQNYVGQVFSDCVVERLHGAGGMAEVFLARRQLDNKEVILKFIHDDALGNPIWKARFDREALILKKLAHPNIVELYTYEADAERPYIIMEFVDGETIAEIIDNGELYEPMDAAKIIMDVAQALSTAHQHGIIHRDIKPSNILVTDKKQIKVLDFGLAKDMLINDGLSMAGQVLGTPQYMAPEQWGNHQVDARCDIFSLGVTLYEMICGVTPFSGAEQWEIGVKISEGKFPHPSELAPDIPKPLEMVIFRMLEADRHFRYSSSRALIKDLQNILAGRDVEVPRLIEKKKDGADITHPLLPGTKFTIGRGDNNNIVIASKSMSRNHAEVARGVKGYTLKDLGSSLGSFVSNMRVREAILKDGDQVKLGKRALLFRDGGLRKVASTRVFESSPDQYRVTTIPEPFIEGLKFLNDKRIVLDMLRQLAPDFDALRVTSGHACVEKFFGKEAADTAIVQLNTRLARNRMMRMNQLFDITHENLGDNVEKWLMWWSENRHVYPFQLASHQRIPESYLHITGGEPKQRNIRLPEATIMLVGRDENSQAVLKHASVSRHHATLLRLHDRLVIRDEGSRFGTQLNDKNVSIAFLKSEDKLTMGKVTMMIKERFAVSGVSIVAGHIALTDSELYFALEQAAHPCVARACARFLTLADEVLWFQSAAQRLFNNDSDGAQSFVVTMRNIYRTRAKHARNVLKKIFQIGPKDPEPDDWEEHVTQNMKDLPRQLYPPSWFPPYSD
ncbi:MAG: FHA domain-containing serine/threonine-protein kinase [Planctomycetota bacterium]|nr:FHA domain-containing serine/threonine-protein kinase [Planctomycetota bacterium]